MLPDNGCEICLKDMWEQIAQVSPCVIPPHLYRRIHDRFLQERHGQNCIYHSLRGNVEKFVHYCSDYARLAKRRYESGCGEFGEYFALAFRYSLFRSSAEAYVANMAPEVPAMYGQLGVWKWPESFNCALSFRDRNKRTVSLASISKTCGDPQVRENAARAMTDSLHLGGFDNAALAEMASAISNAGGDFLLQAYTKFDGIVALSLISPIIRAGLRDQIGLVTDEDVFRLVDSAIVTDDPPSDGVLPVLWEIGRAIPSLRAGIQGKVISAILRVSPRKQGFLWGQLGTCELGCETERVCESVLALQDHTALRRALFGVYSGPAGLMDGTSYHSAFYTGASLGRHTGGLCGQLCRGYHAEDIIRRVCDFAPFDKAYGLQRIVSGVSSLAPEILEYAIRSARSISASYYRAPVIASLLSCSQQVPMDESSHAYDVISDLDKTREIFGNDVVWWQVVADTVPWLAKCGFLDECFQYVSEIRDVRLRVLAGLGVLNWLDVAAFAPEDRYTSEVLNIVKSTCADLGSIRDGNVRRHFVESVLTRLPTRMSGCIPIAAKVLGDHESIRESITAIENAEKLQDSSLADQCPDRSVLRLTLTQALYEKRVSFDEAFEDFWRPLEISIESGPSDGIKYVRHVLERFLKVADNRTCLLSGLSVILPLISVVGGVDVLRSIKITLGCVERWWP